MWKNYKESKAVLPAAARPVSSILHRTFCAVSPQTGTKGRFRQKPRYSFPVYQISFRPLYFEYFPYCFTLPLIRLMQSSVMPSSPIVLYLSLFAYRPVRSLSYFHFIHSRYPVSAHIFFSHLIIKDIYINLVGQKHNVQRPRSSPSVIRKIVK